MGSSRDTVVAGRQRWYALNRAAFTSVPLAHDQFRYAFANADSEDEARQLYDGYSVPALESPRSKPRTPT